MIEFRWPEYRQIVPHLVRSVIKNRENPYHNTKNYPYCDPNELQTTAFEG